MTTRGTDYGMGMTNIDRETGIRYGVIHANDVGQAWFDESEPIYPDPTCENCDLELLGIDVSDDYTCPNCGHEGSGDFMDCAEPSGFRYEGGGYIAYQDQDDPDIFVIKSPYYTRAQFCSPCAPGACYLKNQTPEGERAYCFGPDWFEDNVAPYAVYRVSDDTLVE